LNKAQPDQIELGDTNSYPPSANQMVWSIHWQYQEGNSGYGFSSRVDAITGDILSIGLPRVLLSENEVFYPPKISKEQAIKLAEEFIAQAAPSIPVEQLSLEEDTYLADQPLFGSVYYHLRFVSKVNGVPSPSETLQMSINGELIVLEQAVDMVESVVTIGEDKELSRHSMTDYYRNKEQTVWELNWSLDGIPHGPYGETYG
jgi:hypothetical protein